MFITIFFPAIILTSLTHRLLIVEKKNKKLLHNFVICVVLSSFGTCGFDMNENAVVTPLKINPCLPRYIFCHSFETSIVTAACEITKT